MKKKHDHQKDNERKNCANAQRNLDQRRLIPDRWFRYEGSALCLSCHDDLLWRCTERYEDCKNKNGKDGKSEAIVTTPSPDSDPPPFPAELAIPIPRARTNGTVTGPVVTAPQSQASPKMLRKLGSSQQ